jgi:hypothetical protein
VTTERAESSYEWVPLKVGASSDVKLKYHSRSVALGSKKSCRCLCVDVFPVRMSREPIERTRSLGLAKLCQTGTAVNV